MARRGAADLCGKALLPLELEFPEVYFDQHGRPLGEEAGFDAVIGNPPYMRREGRGTIKAYFAEAYPETYHGVAGLYVCFYQQGLRQLRHSGRMSYIVTNKWLRAGYGKPLRSYFADEGVLEEIGSLSTSARCSDVAPPPYHRRMEAYPLDLRTKIVKSVRRGISKSETARRFGVNRSTVNRYLKRSARATLLHRSRGPASTRN